MSRRRFYLDLPLDDEAAPAIGDVLVGPRVSWRIIDVWPTESDVWPNRWTVTIESPGVPGDPPPEPEPGGIRIHTRPYAPGEGPGDTFGRP